MRALTAGELRIGNWIEWEDDSHEQFQVGSIIKQDSNWFVNGGLLIDMLPIRLTEEWLIKFGFEKEYEGHGCYAFFNKECRIYLLPESFEFELNTLSERHNLCRQYKHVHQLQNLYFALTGEELTIKETVSA